MWVLLTGSSGGIQVCRDVCLSDEWIEIPHPPVVLMYVNHAFGLRHHGPLSPIIASSPSFPLDRARWFRGDVVDDAVDAAHLVDDAGGDAAEKVVREREVVGRHAVARGDGRQCADL